ncbi:DUF6701 domain-containing protein [Pseudomonas fluorescens]|nr:DUF6701 domain-containing protein [Pseudomonas fluorescens]
MSRRAFMRGGLCVVLLAGLALTSLAHAASTYTFGLLGTNAPCSGGWSKSGNTFTCSGQMTLGAGDALATSILIFGNITVVANQGFALDTNAIGTHTKTIALVSVAGLIEVVGTGSTFSASVSSTDGAISMTNATVAGSVQTTNGAMTLVGGTIAGNAQAGGAITATGASVTGNLTSHSGAITLTGGSVGGNVLAAGVITATDFAATGNLTSSAAAITLVRGSVWGDVNAAAAITITDSCIGGSVLAGDAITLTRTTVGSNVQAGGAVTATDSCIEGTVMAGGATSITGGCSSSPVHASCKATPPTTPLDHFAFSYAGAALTCNPQPITISACSSAGCSLYADPVSITLSPSSGWTATPPAVMSGNTITFSGGSAQATLRSGSVGNVSLAVVSSVPASTGPVVCSTSGCTIGYAESGFMFDVPTLISARPQSNIALRAVKKSDTSQACVPGFSDVTRTLSFTSAWLDPGTGSQPVLVNGTPVTGSPRELDLAFDSTGSTPLAVRYDDAGQMILTASYQGRAANNDAGLGMSGSDVFVAKPYGLCLQTDSTCSVAGVDSDCKVFPDARAGDSFPLRIQAVGWLADDEPRTAAALCRDHIVTRNFRMTDIPLASEVVAPLPGDNGTVSPAHYSHASGSQTTTLTSISEVGVFRLRATPLANAYFGETVSGGESGLIGRLIPAYLGVQATASLRPGCDSSFSYQGQPMSFAAGQEPDLKVTGFNRAASITRNYDRGAFWRLAPPVPDAYTSTTGKLSLDASGRLTNSGGASLTRGGVDDGDGSQSYRWSNETLQYTPAIVPLADDRPFIAAIAGSFSAATLTDSDGACFGDGHGCSAYHYDFANNPGSEVRLGRLRLGNAHGSEFQRLDLPLSIETWQNVAGGSFRVEGLDTCTTAAVLQAPGLTSYTGQLSQQNYANDQVTLIAPSAGLGLLRLQPPGVNGSVLGQLPAMPSWLFYDWNGQGREAATGLARFGIYRGSPSMIFHREVYR